MWWQCEMLPQTKMWLLWLSPHLVRSECLGILPWAQGLLVAKSSQNLLFVCSDGNRRIQPVLPKKKKHYSTTKPCSLYICHCLTLEKQRSWGSNSWGAVTIYIHTYTETNFQFLMEVWIHIWYLCYIFFMTLLLFFTLRHDL